MLAFERADVDAVVDFAELLGMSQYTAHLVDLVNLYLADVEALGNDNRIVLIVCRPFDNGVYATDGGDDPSYGSQYQGRRRPGIERYGRNPDDSPYYAAGSRNALLYDLLKFS